MRAIRAFCKSKQLLHQTPQPPCRADRAGRAGAGAEGSRAAPSSAAETWHLLGIEAKVQLGWSRTRVSPACVKNRTNPRGAPSSPEVPLEEPIGWKRHEAGTLRAPQDSSQELSAADTRGHRAAAPPAVPLRSVSRSRRAAPHPVTGGVPAPDSPHDRASPAAPRVPAAVTCLHRPQTGVAEAKQERGAGAAQEGLHPPRPPRRAGPSRSGPASRGRGGAVQHRGELRGPVPAGPPGSAGGGGGARWPSAARLGSARLGREAAPPSPGSARCSAGQPRSGPSPGPGAARPPPRPAAPSACFPPADPGALGPNRPRTAPHRWKEQTEPVPLRPPAGAWQR